MPLGPCGFAAWHETLKSLAAWHWPSLSAKDVYELPIRRSSRVVTLSFLLCSPKYSTWHFSVQAAWLAGNLDALLWNMFNWVWFQLQIESTTSPQNMAAFLAAVPHWCRWQSTLFGRFCAYLPRLQTIFTRPSCDWCGCIPPIFFRELRLPYLALGLLAISSLLLDPSLWSLQFPASLCEDHFLCLGSGCWARHVGQSLRDLVRQMGWGVFCQQLGCIIRANWLSQLGM